MPSTSPCYTTIRGSLDLNFEFPKRLPIPAEESYHSYNHYYNYDYYKDYYSKAEAHRSQFHAAEATCRSPLHHVTELDPEPHEYAPDGYTQPWAPIPKRRFSFKLWIKKCLPAWLKKHLKEE
jgi:hypothetical protein